MASNYWLKLYHEMLDDPKVMTLRPALRWRFVEALLVAGEMGEDGALPDTRTYAWRVRDGFEVVETELTELLETGLLAREGGRWYIPKFAERQSKMSAAERMARMRERRKKQAYYGDGSQSLHEGDEAVTKSNTEEIREDKDREGDCAPAEALRIAISGEERSVNEEQVWAAICDLIDVYCEITRLPWPRLKDKRRVVDNRERWVMPGDTFLRLCDDDYMEAERLLRAVVDRMDADGIPHSSLGSLVTNARSMRFRKASENGAGKDAMLERVYAYARQQIPWAECSADEQEVMRRMTGKGAPEDLRNLKDDALRISFYQAYKEVSA